MYQQPCHISSAWSHIARFMGPTRGPSGSCRPQIGPMLAPWTLLSGMALITSLSGMWGGYPWGRILWGSPGPRPILHLRGVHSALLQELSLPGFEPMSLRLSALNPSRHKNTTEAWQTESDPAPTTLSPLLFLIGLSALARGRCLPWPPMIAGWPR